MRDHVCYPRVSALVELLESGAGVIRRFKPGFPAEVEAFAVESGGVSLLRSNAVRVNGSCKISEDHTT